MEPASPDPAASAGPFHRTNLFVSSGLAGTAASIRSRMTGMVCGSVLMRAERVTAIAGDEKPVLQSCEGQNFVVRHGGIRLSGLRRCQDVMP